MSDNRGKIALLRLMRLFAVESTKQELYTTNTENSVPDVYFSMQRFVINEMASVVISAKTLATLIGVFLLNFIAYKLFATYDDIWSALVLSTISIFLLGVYHVSNVHRWRTLYYIHKLHVSYIHRRCMMDIVKQSVVNSIGEEAAIDYIKGMEKKGLSNFLAEIRKAEEEGA